jgi:anaerobic selenocysteine-containing dehydrogenase
VVSSVCPYCGVGCGQRVYVKNDAVIQIEGHPDSPISRGRLCPKGAARRAVVTSPTRLTKVRYRRPLAADWEDLPLDRAGAFRRAAGALSVAGAGLLIAGRRSRALSAAGAISVLASSVCQRLCVVESGKASALDPTSVLVSQRATA